MMGICYLMVGLHPRPAHRDQAILRNPILLTIMQISRIVCRRGMFAVDSFSCQDSSGNRYESHKKWNDVK